MSFSHVLISTKPEHYVLVDECEGIEKTLVERCGLDHKPTYMNQTFCGSCGIVYAFSDDLKKWKVFLRGVAMDDGYKIFKNEALNIKIIINDGQFMSFGEVDVKNAEEMTFVALGVFNGIDFPRYDGREIIDFENHDIANKKLVKAPVRIQNTFKGYCMVEL